MKKITNVKIFSVIFGLSSFYPLLAFAGTSIGTIIYSPFGKSQSIPTLSGPLLIGLSLILATIAYRVIRHSGSNHFFAIICSIGILGIGSTVGINLIDNAQATAAVICSSTANLSDSMGGQGYVDPSCKDQDVGVKNISGVPLQLDDIVAESSYQVVPPSTNPGCTIGQSIAANSLVECYVRIHYLGCM